MLQRHMMHVEITLVCDPSHFHPILHLSSITFFNKYHYPKSECDCLLGGYTVTCAQVSLTLYHPRVLVSD